MSSSSTASELDALIGLSGAKRVIRSFYQSQVECHALLFYGAEGSGKEELARAVAQLWLCLEANPESGADGSCRACAALGRGANPDLLVISPTGPSRLITVPQLRLTPESDKPDAALPLEVFFRTPPLLSKNKVVIMSQADRMNQSSSNALLKTLEEPPSFGKLILTTDSIGGVRPTILSRTLAVACELPAKEDLQRHAPEAGEDEMFLSEMAPGRLATVLKHPQVYRDLIAFARALPLRPRREALVASEELRELSERLEKTSKCGMRAAHAEVLRMLSLVFARDPSFPRHWAGPTITAHERVLGNGNAGLVMDALFARILS